MCFSSGLMGDFANTPNIEFLAMVDFQLFFIEIFGIKIYRMKLYDTYMTVLLQLEDKQKNKCHLFYHIHAIKNLILLSEINQYLI